MASNDPQAQDSKARLTWLITGCSSGFGLELTRQVLAAGHTVIATSRNPSRTPDLVSEVTSAGGQWLKLDVDDPNCGQVIGDLEAAGTHIDVLINSAGFGIVGPVEAFSDAEIRRLLETNFFGPYRLMRAAVPYMRKRRSGVVVNLTSGSGMEARAALGGYGASKSALDNITKVLAKEVAEFNVRVLLVYLGSFDTPMGSATKAVAQPLDQDYVGGIIDKTLHAFDNGFRIDGDHKKACRAIYEMVVGEGIGKGNEKEYQMVLGTDMADRAWQVRDGLNHMMDVFGDICNNVRLDQAKSSKD